MPEIASIAVLAAGIVRLMAEWLNGNKDRRGWYLMMVSSLMTAAWSYATGATAFLPMAVATAFVAFRGLRRWEQMEFDHRREIHRLNNVVLAKELHIAQLEGRI